MNVHEHVLESMLLPQYQVKEVTKCLLHTIVHARALGLIRPTEVESDMIGVTYMSCGVDSVDEAVKTCAENFSKSLRLSGPGTTRGRLILSFYERHKKKKFFGMSVGYEKKIWEQWIISVTVQQKKLDRATDFAAARAAQLASTKRLLQKQVRAIVQRVNESMRLLPRRKLGAHELVFPFELNISKGETPSEGWFSKILQTRPPTLTV